MSAEQLSQLEHRKAQNRKHQRNWKARNPERAKELQAATRSRRAWKIKAWFSNDRAAKAGRPGTVTADELRELFIEQVGKCHYCGEMIIGKGKCYVDHIIPLSNELSTNDISNIVLACPSCSSSKHNSDPGEWLLKREFKALAERLMKAAGVS